MCLRWNAKMPGGEAFDQESWTSWREAAKTYIWSLMADPAPGQKPLRPASVRAAHNQVRVLIEWMHRQGHRSFADLDRDVAQQFMANLKKRKRRGSNTGLAPTTLGLYERELHRLYLQGLRYPALACDEPFPGRTRGTPRSDRGRWPHTPDEVAVPLLMGALRLVGQPASDVVTLYTHAQDAYNAALTEGRGPWAAREAALHTVADVTFATLPGESEPWHPYPITSTARITWLVDRIYDACFVLIAWLVGMRVSEIVGLQVGCVERETSLDGTEERIFLNGRIYKTASDAQGDPHRWIAPDCVERAIEILTSLSAPLRARTGRTDLWLTSHGAGLLGPNAIIDVVSTNSLIERLNDEFAPFIELPPYHGKPWHLTTHQGRKTFARLMARQDRTGLQALAEHLGHRSIVMTDRGYAGVDDEVLEMMGETVREEMARAFEDALTANDLAGKMGAKIVARSPWRGQTVNEEIRDYARSRLMDPNFSFEVCDYGYCYYRRRHSACHGDDLGPNPALRTQSTCLQCKNFVVAPKHRPVWEDRRDRYASVLQGGGVDPAVKEDIRAKVEECDNVLARIAPRNGATHAGDER